MCPDASFRSNNLGAHRAEARATCLFFLLILFIPLVLAVISVGRDETILKNGEYRMPSPRPSVPMSLASAVAFTWQWEEYWRDIFPFRGPLIYLHGEVRYKKLRANSKNIIFIGDNYVFNVEEIDCFRGKTGRTDEEVATFLEIVDRKRKFFRQHGIAYYFVLAPSRVGFLREWLDHQFKLPDEHALKYKINSMMSPEVRDCFIIPDEMMHAYKVRYPDRPLFFSRDNHWTHWGRAVAAAAIVNHLQNEFPGIPTLDPLDIPFVEAPEDRSFWAYLRLLGVDFDMFPPPLTIRTSPEWPAIYERLTRMDNRSTLNLCYASDSFMEILSQTSPEILSFASVKRLDPLSVGLKSPQASLQVVDEHPDIVLESVVIDALASKHFEGFMKSNAGWLSP